MAKGSKALKTMNAYGKGIMQRVEECRTRLLESAILDISRSLTNLVDGKKNKKRKEKAKGSKEGNRDLDYSPGSQSSEEEQEEEQQRSNHAKAVSKLVMTRSYAPSQKYVPPMMLNKLLKQSKQRRQVGENGKGKAPTMAELILKKKQPNQEAALETPTPLAGCLENQLVVDADLEWLLELDETRHVNVDEEDKSDGESQNPADDGESAAKENDEGADDDGNDEEVDSDKEEMDDSDNEDVDDNEAEQNTVNETEQQVAIGRGPTMMHPVHMRPLEKREAIILNEFGQPIGPVTPKKDTIGEFSRFLGTIARDYGNALLTYRSWRKVPGKDKLWEYVLSKYLVPEEGKEWVLKSIGAAWRIHKCRFKKRHYHKYTTNNLRWMKRPKTIPEEDFKQLLLLWNKKEEKEPMKSYQPIEDESDPKDAFMGVMEKEYPGRRRLFGRGVTNKVLKKSVAAAGSYVVPKEVMDAVRADMEAEKTEIGDIRKELEADYEQKKANLEADYAKKMEHFDKSRESLVKDILQKLIAKLPSDVVREFLV
ncbi:hypothetical protein BVRB_002010 [Beta vulgaris subsp. vulgaris]|uniref:Transposase, Ptta/En/Spm n=1 Tax=Beta vulgaris subsp. vulgaris TaxID=3555 RepID=A0A0J8B4H9_BETVV|nr:hypothetical protein BVRB_002010 [Beta vulgaris subsp. vulgaris]